MSYSLQFSKTALEDIEKHKKSGDKSTLKKIEKLLNELREHPTVGTGKPEIMKYESKDLYSRRINKKHRLIYSVDDHIITVYVINLWSHYGDK
jgi:toxin YoeB